MSRENILLSVFAFLLLGFYHIFFLFRVCKKSEKTSLGLGYMLRRIWVMDILKTKRDLLGVHTLRNQLMAASFLASTAILISLGVLGLAANPSFYDGFLLIMERGGGETNMALLKLGLISLNFFISFFNFTLCIRYYNHASFAISLSDTKGTFFSEDLIASIINRGSLYYFLGMRGYYISVPLLLWVMGSLCLLIGSLFLLIVLFIMDAKL